MKLNESSFLLGEELDFEKVHMISNDKISVSLSEHSRVKIETSNKRLIELLNKGEDIYGLTTGVGALKGIKLTPPMKTFRRVSYYLTPLGSAPLYRKDILRL